jgi:hypothetical protein
VLAQLVISDEPARNNKGILQTFSFPECDVEKGIAKICPPGLVLAAANYGASSVTGNGGDAPRLVARQQFWPLIAAPGPSSKRPTVQTLFWRSKVNEARVAAQCFEQGVQIHVPGRGTSPSTTLGESSNSSPPARPGAVGHGLWPTSKNGRSRRHTPRP